jgi:hypothetical protein
MTILRAATLAATILLAVLLTAVPMSAQVPQAPAVPPPQILVEAPPALAGTAAQLRALDPSRLVSVMHLVGLTDPGPPIRVILAPEGSGAATVVPPWVSGYAMGEQGVIVLLPGRVPSYPDSSLADLLSHEVAHVLIARAAGGRPLPRWFHEGMAMIAGLSWGFDDRSRLTLALLVDRPVSLAELDDRFAGGQSEVNRAYAIAGAFVRDLFDQYGQGVAARLLRGVAAGQSFADAFRAATGVPMAAAEADFWGRQTFWYRWIPLLTSSGALWMIVTALALWAMRRRRQRDALLRQGWDAEDERLRLAAEARALAEAPVAPRDEAGEWVN